MDYHSEEQIAARELRVAAYHEAGHKAICERFGGTGDAVVWRNRRRAPDEAAWLGQFRMRVCPQAMHVAWSASGFQVEPLPLNWNVLFGMAGLVAEEILSGDTDDDAEVVTYNLYVRISTGQASKSDLAEMGIRDINDFELDNEVVGEGVRLLREVWATVEREAERLIAAAARE
ncbi:hypothetical protein CFB84_20250 [Burkholderia aenigmatica]|uniref:Peptidase M41 domain-containing protein n=2 Tax=Burkholderia aenigmatica TaxID=2015348 RepID=A0A228IPF1_9BURK|nr:hypothetical protein CFB84_20250 [Burkholderia aenigmatica]